MSIAIEKGVPLPVDGRSARRVYPLHGMDVGDSFFVAGAKITTLSASIAFAQKRTGFKFTARTVDGGVRVWRTA